MSAASAGRPPRRRRALWWTAVFVATLVLIGGITTAVASYVQVPGPGQVVTSYFSALRAGDAAKALSFGRAPSGDTRYLTAGVLRQQASIAPLKIGSISTTATQGSSASVTAAYSFGEGAAAKSFTDKITLHRADRHWLMDSVAATVRIDYGNGKNRASFAGLALPNQPIALFPGPAPVVYDTDYLHQDPLSDAIRLSSSGTLLVTPELTDRGLRAIGDGVKAAMTKCLELAAKAPASCPMTPGSGRSIPGSLRGKVTAADLGDSRDLVSGNNDGLIEVDGTIDVTGSWQTLDFNNLPVNRSGSTTVPVSVQLYASKPNVVSWQKS